MLLEKEGIVLICKEAEVRCEEQIFATNYKTIFLTKKRLSNTPSSNNLASLGTYFNAKLDFIVTSLHEKMKMIYYTVVNQMCQVNYETLRNKLSIASKHPELAGRLLTEQHGTYGMLAGEVLYFYTCQEVDVVVRKTDHCTQELSVTYRNRTFFIASF